jgi:hypothetical protein
MLNKTQTARHQTLRHLIPASAVLLCLLCASSPPGLTLGSQTRSGLPARVDGLSDVTSVAARSFGERGQTPAQGL